MSLKQLSKHEIKDMFTNPVYNRGLKYYREGRVRDLHYNPVRNSWAAMVRGSESYEVTIEEMITEFPQSANVRHIINIGNLASISLRLC